ncbi:putative membrane channel-forming protein YqfA (hemolysin III family) [Streptacidiphilus sp. MAP12-20]|uniref:YrdB family protein n=1 Tax=Streptacidiphilus sp. MAP12-20 TaxID=3156299 RepID=UPI0035182992
MLWTALKDANLLLAFLLELAVYASAAWWAWTRPRRRPRRHWLRPFAALATVSLFAIVWGTFCAPSATFPLHGLTRAAVELAWYGAGAAALACRTVRTPCAGAIRFVGWRR